MTSFSDYEKNGVETAIADYLNRLYDRLRLTKNTIFRSEPVSFNANYIPLTLKSENNNLRVTDPHRLIIDFNKLGIIGSAGSGKTTLLRHIALSCIENGSNIPIVIELRNYNSSKMAFEDFVALQVSEVLYSEIKKVFKEGKFIFIFDGYDEIDYIQGNSFINQLEKFVSKYSENSFVISSRPGTNVESLIPFYMFSICPLNEDDIYLFIEKINIPSQLRKKLFFSIQNDHYFKGILNIPLFLSLYILTFNSINTELPTKKSVFLRNIIDSLFSLHDSISKLGYVRKKLSGLDRDSLEDISSILAFRTFFSSKVQLTKDELYQEFQLIKKANQYNFENDNLLYDLTITINILNEIGNYYYFPHVLILEYLTASFVGNLNMSSKTTFYNKIGLKKSFNLSPSFFDFLYELDYSAFIEYFLIPSLENFVKNPFEIEKDEVKHYNRYSLLDFVRNNPAFNVGSVKESSLYFGEISTIINELKNEIRADSKDNSNPLLDILN